MAYMIVCFANNDGSAPMLYQTGDGYAVSLDRARGLVDHAARTFSRDLSDPGGCQYAVFATDRTPATAQDFNFNRLSAPVYVPSLCIEAARAQGWRIPGEAPAAPVAAAYPIDPSLPVELDNGTRAEIDGIHETPGNVRVRLWGPYDLTPPVAGHAYHEQTWVYHLRNGEWAGAGDGWPRLRNVLPAVSPIIPAAVAAAARPLPPVASPEAPQVRFEVRAGLNGTNRDDWSAVAQFDTGKDAADWQRDNRQAYVDAGKSLAIVRVELTAPSVDWRAREQGRLDDGTYTRLPGDWGDSINHCYPDLFAHVSAGDKTKVAFTETPAAGERDRQKVLSASEFASRHMGRYFYTHEQESFIADMLGSSVNVLFAPLGDADAMQSLYEECDEDEEVSSCMSHSEDHYQSSFHPVRVYAMGGDLTLAFLRGDSSEGSSDHCGDEDCDSCNEEYGELDSADRCYSYPSASWNGSGSITARCLVWPDRKEFGRVYGSSAAQRLLRSGLQALGYRSSDLNGARLAKVRNDEDEEPNGRGAVTFVMPYLDAGGQSFSDSECGHYFVTGGGTYGGGSTSGIVYVSAPVECGHCGEMVPGDQTRVVYVSEDDREQWCESCCSETAYSSHRGHVIPETEAVRFHLRTGRDAYRDTCATWELEDYRAENHPDTVLCHDGTYRDYAFQCRDCGEVFPIAERRVHGADHVCGDCHIERDRSPSPPLEQAA